MTMSSVFLVLEPDVADESGRRMFEPHEEQAIAFMLLLSPVQRGDAVLYDSILTKGSIAAVSILRSAKD